MMASRGLTISGSGTSMTSILCFPCQVTARIFFFLLQGLFGGGFVLALGGARRAGHFAGLEELLEPPQVAADLQVRLALQEFGDPLADAPSRRIICEGRADHRSALWRGVEKL